ncbi:MAG: AbrB/MazE/SpoVT family DNA-binding domain-containing protein [Deltaproteobacteria bacterium]|nr:AbrB/MazE/SpoVT family DNA-binding domain-containing protein [Deltaproteobacteria bacterium]
MKTAIVRIGNSRGIRIPKPLLEQYRLRDEVEMEIREDGLLIRGVAEPRSGWDDAFRRMRERNDDTLVDEGSSAATRWDVTEWEW